MEFQKKSLSGLELDTRLYRTIIDSLNDGVYVLRKDKKIVFWNEAASRITGYSSDEVIGRDCSGNILSSIDNSLKSKTCFGSYPVLDALKDGKLHEQDFYLSHKDGHQIPVFSKALPLKDEKGAVTAVMEIFVDKSAQMSVLYKIADLEATALIDQLTKSGNRRYTENILDTRLNEFQRYEWQFGIFFVDIDDFKKINDNYSHVIGDKVLEMVTKTILSNCRISDFVGRWGGDEFIVVVVNVDYHKLSLIAQRLRLLVEKSKLKIQDNAVGVTVSIGAALVKPEDTRDSLIKKADALMYQSKLSGKNKITLEPLCA